MYYIKYNGVDLTEIINVKEVEIPSLPSMSHSSTDMFERNGSVYNGMNYGTRDIIRCKGRILEMFAHITVIEITS